MRQQTQAATREVQSGYREELSPHGAVGEWCWLSREAVPSLSRGVSRPDWTQP